jgi:hypothetical protein
MMQESIKLKVKNVCMLWLWWKALHENALDLALSSCCALDFVQMTMQM